jgi:hypothetical protein
MAAELFADSIARLDLTRHEWVAFPVLDKGYHVKSTSDQLSFFTKQKSAGLCLEALPVILEVCNLGKIRWSEGWAAKWHRVRMEAKP